MKKKRSAPKKTGRPTKLTPEVTTRFLNAIKLGAPYELACNYAGISYNTLLNWKERKEPAFVEFFQELTRAEGAAAVQWLALLEKHAQADGKWAAWKLERRYPESFGRQDKLTIDVNKLDSDIERELAAITAGSQADSAGEAEESIH